MFVAIGIFLTTAAAAITSWYVKRVITSGVKEREYALKAQARREHTSMAADPGDPRFAA